MSKTSGIAMIDEMIVPDRDDYLSMLFPPSYQKKQPLLLEWVLRGHVNEIVVWKERKA